MVKISVIIPVYNVEKYLRESMDSLMNQSFQDAEFIMVDDGSKDSSPDICREYTEKDKRFKLISQPNGGPAKARNTGMDAAKGEYICFMDSDDLLAEEALQKMYDMVQGYDILVHGTEFIGDYDEVPAWISVADRIEQADIEDFSVRHIFSMFGCGPVLWLHFIKADLIQKEHLRINENLTIGEDFSFAVTYFANAKKVKFVKDKFYAYRLFRKGSLMTTFQDMPKEKLDQSLYMSKVIYNSIKDKIKPTDEAAIINILLIFNFRDFYRLDEDCILEYADTLERYMDVLHIESHAKELSGMNIMMLGYLKGIKDGSVKISNRNRSMTAQEYWKMFV
ncbi:MAG: glycosyltransferase family 2 protein [archaeon]|nr:glycosyltransferase family 2 protein [archaeon]